MPSSLSFFLALFHAATLSAILVFGQQGHSAQPPTGLTASQPQNSVVCAFIQNEAELKQARARVQGARHQYQKAISYAWPQVEAQSSFQHSKAQSQSSTQRWQMGFQVTQSLLTGGRLSNALGQYKKQIQKSELELQSLKQKKISDLILLISQLSLLQQQIKSLNTLLQQQQSLVRVAQKQQARRGVNDHQLAQSQASLSALQVQKIILNEQLSSLKRQLQHQLQSSRPVSWSSVQGQLNTQVLDKKIWQAWKKTFTQLGPKLNSSMPLALRPAFQQVLKKRLDYQLLQLSLQLSQHARALELAEHKVTLNLVAHLDWLKNTDRSSFAKTSPNKSSSNAFKSTVSYALQLKIPLFSGLRVRAQRREWEQTLLQIRVAQQQLERDIFHQLQQAWSNYSTLKQKIKLNKTWKQQSHLAWRRVLTSHRVGRAGVLQVVQLQSAYQQAENSLLQTEHAFRKIQVQLLAAMGEPFQLYGCR